MVSKDIRNVDVIKLSHLVIELLYLPTYLMFCSITLRKVLYYCEIGPETIFNGLYYPESLNHSFSATKSSLSSSEVSLLTCSATIHYPPLTSISIVKNEIVLKTAVNTTLTVSTDRLGVSPFGSYQCRVNATGIPFTRELMIKERGMCIFVTVSINIFSIKLILCSLSKDTASNQTAFKVQ